MGGEQSNPRVYWVTSNLADQSRFLGTSLVAIAIWAVGLPIGYLAAPEKTAAAGAGLFVASCAVGLILWISTFTTIDRFRAIAKSLPDDIADMAFSRHFQANPWFAFAFAITAVHIGVLVGHGILFLG